MQITGGTTALMYACQQCKEIEVLEILKKQPHSVKHQDRTLKTPLHYCAENPNTSCAEAVLKVAPELVNAQDENGYCTLHLAVIAGNKPLIKLLITKGANVNVHDNEGHSAVHWAIVSSEKEALEIIICAGANPSTPDIHGGYPLHYAVQMCGPKSDYIRNSEDTVRVVETLLKFGVDVNVKDKDGRQPILWAASAGSADAVIHLVSGGACVEAADKDGLTALHCAASRGHTTTLETLISLCGANVDVIDGNGCSPLFYSVTLGHADATELLLQLGADPNRQDRKGRTPAHCGAAKGQLETLRILKKHDGNLWMRNVRGDIPLHEAVASGRKDLVLWLLSQNSEAINIANNDGRCPLHIASMYNNTEMVKVLLDSKSLVNPVMRTSKGILMTPLNVALCKGHRSCGKYLQLHGGVPFSKVSKVEPASVFAVRISPSNDTMIVTTETSKEIVTSSQSKISKSKRFIDTQENRKKSAIRLEAADKKKVCRRRKKKKNSSSINSQNSDSEDSIRNLNLKTADSRKNEKSNEDDGSDEENNEDEDKMEIKNVLLDIKEIKKERSSESDNNSCGIDSDRKKEIAEEPLAVKRITKIKTESKRLQRNKSFNETKNVSDLSPEDFPALMQTINQLDSVIMEPDIEVSKPEIGAYELRLQEASAVDLSSDSAVGEIKKRKIFEKRDLEIKVCSGDALSNDETNIHLVKGESVQDDDEKIKKESLATEEKLIKASTVNKSNGGILNYEMVMKSHESKSSSGESIKLPKSPNKENLIEKDSKSEGKSNGDTEGKDIYSKAPENSKFEQNGRSSFDAKVNNKSGGVEEFISPGIKSDGEVNLGEKTRIESEANGIGFNNKTIKGKLESESEAKKKIKSEILGENKIEEEIAKNNEETNILDSSLKKEDSRNVPENLTDSLEKEGIKVSEIQTSEKIKTAHENEVSVNITATEETYVKPFEENVTETKISESFDSSGNVGTFSEKIEKPSAEILSVVSSSDDSSADDFDETAKKPLKVTIEPNVENFFRTTEKSLAEGDNTEKSFLSIKKEKDFIHEKTKDSILEENDKRNQVSEINYEDAKSRDEESPYKKSNNSDRRQYKTPKMNRLCRRHRDFKQDMKQISVTQLVQNTIRKYHMERGIFYQLLELKRCQIRSGRANEQVLVKRLADEYEKSRAFLGMKPFSGLYKFREFEKFLYDQLKALNTRRSFTIPEIKSYDDIDALSGFLKKSRYKMISDLRERETVCTCITQRCHHSACAYTSVPCSAYITDLRRHKHHKPRKECFFPRIDQTPPLKLQTQKFTEQPATLELIQGSEKHVIMLPQSSSVRGKRYYVTFTVKGAPSVKEEDSVEDPKRIFKHRHASSV